MVSGTTKSPTKEAFFSQRGAWMAGDLDRTGRSLRLSQGERVVWMVHCPAQELPGHKPGTSTMIWQ